MRVLMIIDGMAGGGAEKVVLTLCQGMQQMGHNVSLFSLAETCSYDIPVGINYQVIVNHSSKPWRKLTELSRRAYSLDKAVSAEQTLNGDFDLVFSNLHKTDRIVSRSKVINFSRLWFCIHGMLSHSYLEHRKGLSRRFKQHKITRIYNGKNIIAVSQAVGDNIRYQLGIRPGTLAVINNPFDIANILQQASEPCELEGSEYLIHVGRFHISKRHDRLLRAYALSAIPAKLVLLGDGDPKKTEEIKQLAETLGIAERVILAGFQANPFPFIKHAVMLVLSSDNEGFGNVLVEALLCGTPVVSTRCPGGAVEIMQKAGMEQALAEMNEYSLANKMLEIYNTPPNISFDTILAYGINQITRQYLSVAEKSSQYNATF